MANKFDSIESAEHWAIRLYIEQHTSDASKYELDAQDFLKPEIKFATDLLKFKEFVGRDEPDVKT